MNLKTGFFVLAAVLMLGAAQIHGQGSTSEGMSMGWLSGIMNLLYPLLEWEIDALVGIIMFNPTAYCLPITMGGHPDCKVSAGLDQLLPYFIAILVPLYIAAILFTALYYIVKSTNPRGRARAKAMLTKLLFSMVLVSMAPVVYQTLLDMSSIMVDAVYNMEIFRIESLVEATSFGQVVGACCMILAVAVVLLIAGIIAAIRYFFVVAFGAIFPILIFLYFFDLTRGWGRKYIKQAVSWIFTPVVQMLWLAFTMIALESTGTGMIHELLESGGVGNIVGPFAGIMMAMVGVSLVAISPLLMSHLMSLIGGGIFAVGVAANNTWVTALGGLMEGRQDAAIHAAKSVLTRSTPVASAIHGITRGYGAVLGPQGPTYSPDTIAKGEGGNRTMPPSGGFPETGGEGGPRYDRSAWEREQEAIDARGRGPIGARGGSIATSAPPKRGGRSSRRTLKSAVNEAVSTEMGALHARGQGVIGARETPFSKKTGKTTTPHTLKTAVNEAVSGEMTAIHERGQGVIGARQRPFESRGETPGEAPAKQVSFTSGSPASFKSRDLRGEAKTLDGKTSRLSEGLSLQKIEVKKKSEDKVLEAKKDIARGDSDAESGRLTRKSVRSAKREEKKKITLAEKEKELMEEENAGKQEK